VSSPALAPGTRLGPYEVLEPIAYGGMGTVYRGHDATLDRAVALKVLRSELLEDASFAERFKREAQIWARLDHRAIVPVYLADIEGDHPFLAMKFVAGGALSDVLKTGPLPLERALGILADVASALDYAHGQGIVHRDVKPANVLLGEEGRAYLSDFGIARVVASSRHAAHTGGVVGTPGYMAPEQARGQQPDPRSDIYSLGCMAYEMLTAQPPFQGDSPVHVLMRHISETPPPPSSVVPELPSHVERAVLKAMAKEPDQRWPTASYFIQALRGHVDVEKVQTVSLHPHTPSPLGAGATPLPTPTPAPGRSRRPRWLALAALAVALLILTVLVPTLGRAPGPAPEAAAPPSARALLSAVERYLDDGRYPDALEVAEAALRLNPADARALALRERVHRAWEAEKALGLWAPSAALGGR
jgi:serine/threonine protein kinase